MITLRPLEAQEAVDKLCDHLLGDDWYIVDPICCTQANAIIVDEIISRYRGATESPANKWRRRHKKCRFCKHCSYTPSVAGHSPKPWCDVKQKIVNDKRTRLFCGPFQLRPYYGFKQK